MIRLTNLVSRGLRSLLLLGVLASFVASTADAANIVIQNNNAAGVGFNDPTPRAPVGGNPGTTLGAQRLYIFQYAADIWSALLPSGVTIVVRAQFAAQTCTATSATLGSAGTTTIHRDFSGAPFAGTWYNQALANKLFGSDLSAANPDINATFNLSIDAGCFGPGQVWYYGTDGNEGTNIELLPVVLHEIGHGLGFQTFTNGSTGAYNSGFPSIADRFLYDNVNNLHWNENTAAQRAASTISIDKLSWDGAAVTKQAASFLGARPVMKINSPAGKAGTYAIQTATFGAPITAGGFTGNVVLADDGVAPNADGCTPLVNGGAVSGNIVLIDRGTCTFVAKAQAAQAAGATGLIVANNVAAGLPGMGGTDPSITIPCVGISQADGNSIKANLGAGVNVTFILDPSLKAGADNAGRALMYAPNPFASGSSVSHFDISLSPNALMEPAINNDLHTNLDLTPYMFRDIGWFPTSSLSLVASPAKGLCDQPVTLTATVSPAGNAKGSVEFFDGASSLGVAPVSGNTTATLVLPSMSLGSHSLTAVHQCGTCSTTVTSPKLSYEVNPGLSVQVTSPNGGENWGVATQQKIAWTATASCTGPVTIAILLSTDGGGSYPITIATGQANDGTYTWDIPKDAPITSQARIKIVATDAQSNVMSDASDANFNLYTGGVQAELAAACISAAHPCIEIPVTLHRPDMQGVRAYSVTLQLSPNLTLCGSGIADAGPGGFLQSVGGAFVGPVFVTNHGGGSYTVDQSILGNPCGATATDGTLFTIHVSGVGPDAPASITVTAADLRKCDNAVEPVGSGAPLVIDVDNTGPAAITNLVAAQQTVGNDGDGTTKVGITFTAPGDAATVEVYRAGYGQYPEYDDNGGAVPATPGSYPPGPPWVLTSVGASGQSDETTQRDFYYYVAYAKDACGNVGPVSNQTGGTLNYHLGDWHDGVTNCQGNNQVNTSDLSFLGAHYGITLSHVGDPYACLDVGPTTTNYVNGRPLTDDHVQFEDFVLMSINYLSVSLAPGKAPEAAMANEVRLTVPAAPGIGETFTVGVEMSGTGDIQALSALLNYDRNVVEPLSVSQGELLVRQIAQGMVLSSEPGNVDVALLGTSSGGIAGSGRIAEMTFRVKAVGDPAISIRHLEARSASNQPVSLGVTEAVTVPPARTMLSAVSPNPFQSATTIQLSLSTGGLVKVGVFDVAGRQVRSLVNGYQLAGQKLVSWDGRNDAGVKLAMGMYVIRMEAGGAMMSRRVAMVR
jgi:hypothetical protein